MKQLTLLLIISLLLSINAQQIYKNYYPKARELVAQMSIAQKIGQMTQVDIQAISNEKFTDITLITKYNLGSVLIGGNGAPDDKGNMQVGDINYKTATMENWQRLMERLNSAPVKVGNTQINLITGTDAVHGNQHVLGEVLFPHNIGLAATHNPENFKNAGHWTALSVLKSGFNYAFAPTVAVSHNPQWGRYYETMGFDESYIGQYAQNFVDSAQQQSNFDLAGVYTSTKHFLGDGATYNGNDEGNDKGYYGGIKAATSTIMVSYSAINDVGMSINSQYLHEKLKTDMGFDGILISDYGIIQKIATQGLPTSWLKFTDYQATCMIVNSGMDMFMIPGNMGQLISFQKDLQTCVEQGEVNIERLDDAVTRIIAVKYAKGLIALNGEKIKTPEFKVKQNAQPWDDALTAAQESLVLLKNDNQLLPIDQNKVKNVIFIGERTINVKNVGNQTYQDFNNIGLQNGGWSVRWQGFEGNDYWGDFLNLKNMSHASSILDGFKSKTKLSLEYTVYKTNTQAEIKIKRQEFLSHISSLVKSKALTQDNTIVIGVLGESPYAEFMGDINCEYCYNTTKQVEGCLYNSHINDYLPDQQKTNLNINYDDYSKQVLSLVPGFPLATILLSGRTMIIDEPLKHSNSFIAGFWPGTQGGEAITNALIGNYLMSQDGKKNTLPSDWLSKMSDIQDFPIYEPEGELPQQATPLFKMGYGLKTSKKGNSEQEVIDM